MSAVAVSCWHIGPGPAGFARGRCVHDRPARVPANCWRAHTQPIPVHWRAKRSGWDFRVFQRRGRQKLVRKRASLWSGFVRNLKLVSVPVVPGFTVGNPNLSGWLSHKLVIAIASCRAHCYKEEDRVQSCVGCPIGLLRLLAHVHRYLLLHRATAYSDGFFRLQLGRGPGAAHSTTEGLATAPMAWYSALSHTRHHTRSTRIR